MPPKKKVSTRQVVTENPIENKETQPLIETPTIPTATPKIPNKPFLRTVKLCSLTKIQEIRVKFWKLKSFHLGKGKPFDYDSLIPKQIFANLSSQTLRKSLRTIKNFNITRNGDIRIPDLKKLFPYLSKAESLAVRTKRRNALTKIFVKKFLNPQIKHFDLSLDFLAIGEEGKRFLRKTFKYYNRLKKGELRLPLQHPFPPWVPTIIGVKGPVKISQISQSQECHFLDSATLSLNDKLQELSISYDPSIYEHIKIEIPPEIKFPNLTKLDLKFQSKPENPRLLYLSFIGNSPNLEVLNLDLAFVQIQSLDFLSHLSKLRDFSLAIKAFKDTTVLHEVPNIPTTLTTLERLKIYFEWGVVNMPNILQLIQMNKNLKTLELFLSIDRIIEDFTEDIGLPSVQNLTLAILKIDPTNLKKIKAFQASLLNFKQIQKLDLQLDALFVNFLHPTLKTLEQFSNLKKLNVTALYSGELEDKKFAKFKDLFKKLPKLKSLGLDFEAELMNSRELTSLVDGLAFLEDLQAFNFKASLVKITPVAFTKFTSLLESRRQIREMKIKAKGLNEEEEEELQKISDRGHQLWEEIIEEKNPLKLF